MSRIPRKAQKIFASGAANNGQFGSAQAGTKVLSNDLDVLQALPAYLQGWLDATLGAKKFPTLEEFQSLNYINTTQIAYLFQEGIPEYNSGTTYYNSSIVKETGTYNLYGSLVDDNLGNALSDATKWKLLINLAAANATAYNAIAPTTGTANAQIIATTDPHPYVVAIGNIVNFEAGASNTSAMTLKVEADAVRAVLKSSGSGGGLVPLVNGDVVDNSTYQAQFNGTVWVLQTTPFDPAAFLQVVNNLSDVASAAAALSNLGGAPKISPAFTGSPTAPTQAVNDRTTKLATTQFANPAANFGTAGYIELPNGMFVQWGTGTASGSPTFTTPFPNALYGIICQYNASIADGINPIAITARSNSGFTSNSVDAGSTPIYWIAWGT